MIEVIKKPKIRMEPGWNEQAWPNFKPEEFLCKCKEDCTHKDIRILDPKVVELLQLRRKEVELPMTILSGLRCEKHNKKVGGAKNSRHKQGKAADFTYADFDAIGEAMLWGIQFKTYKGGIIAYPENNFIHIDTDMSGKPYTRHFIKLEGEPYEAVEFRGLHNN